MIRVVEPIDALRYEVDREEANAGWFMRDRSKGKIGWVATVRWNGEPLEAKQTATGKAMAAGPELLDLLTLALPYLETAEEDPAYKPSVVGKLSTKVRAVIASATHEIEEKPVE